MDDKKKLNSGETANTNCRECGRHVTNGGSRKSTLPTFCTQFVAVGKEQYK